MPDRNAARGQFPDQVRLALLEQDVDQIYRAFYWFLGTLAATAATVAGAIVVSWLT